MFHEGASAAGVAGAAGAAVAPSIDEWLAPDVGQRLVAVARRFVRDRGEAEDIAQEALLRARDHLDTLRSPDRAEAWLFRICRHAAIDHARARRVRRAVWAPMPRSAEGGEVGERGEGGHGHGDSDADGDGSGNGNADAAGGAGREAEGREPRVLVGGAEAAAEFATAAAEPQPVSLDLRALPAHQRLLVSLHYEHGVTHPTLCRMTGLQPSALRVRLFRARGALLSASEA